MEIKENYSLKSFNTFGITANARFFTEITSESDLKELFELPLLKENKKLFLGGGSNVLFTKDFPGIVILNKLKGIKILDEDDESVLIQAMGGENWHNLVSFAVSRGYWGIENLSLIPGTVGAAPMQNIGAYGAELKNVLESVLAYEIETGKKRVFGKEECNLGYRDSIFKNELKDKYFISSVVLRLNKKEEKNLTYKVLRDHLEKNKIEVKNSKDISDAVADIRRSKLPDPALIGNAGSFFKNVFLDKEEMKEFLKKYPNAPFFEEEGAVKIPAGWLIEACGWKGKRVGNVGVHDKQALVLVNYGGATGEEVKTLAEQIIDSVFKKFGLNLVPEVNLI
jgi:UDP-N-acetylmuramate dehydrogenase